MLSEFISDQDELVRRVSNRRKYAFKFENYGAYNLNKVIPLIFFNGGSLVSRLVYVCTKNTKPDNHVSNENIPINHKKLITKLAFEFYIG